MAHHEHAAPLVKAVHRRFLENRSPAVLAVALGGALLP